VKEIIILVPFFTPQVALGFGTKHRSCRLAAQNHKPGTHLTNPRRTAPCVGKWIARPRSRRWAACSPHCVPAARSLRSKQQAERRKSQFPFGPRPKEGNRSVIENVPKCREWFDTVDRPPFAPRA